MSAQLPVSGPSTVTIRPQRIRHDNGQSLGVSASTKDLLMTGGAIAIGAIGGYYIVDYIVKNKIFDSILESVPDLGLDTGTEPEEEEEEEDDKDKEAKIAYTLPYDRETRINSYPNSYGGLSAYRGRKLPKRLGTIDFDITEIDDIEDVGFNQVFTEDQVYDV